ncbi:hypothetical protein GCM10011613_07010 [Cellvibrio zantedeschiae]|uniref:Uncharacterized protein n=1 Tax=Cellvibrio zantedeschiae TaxID=1237077 RepID=A0ABQ3ASB5_9GAMM|nr:hypothetical protein [Cellvibrio zantedeschiae]GGY65727.1 hypothetical protein GCM10011613_07010 [Cellvibrio zantedeschiae]
MESRKSVKAALGLLALLTAASFAQAAEPIQLKNPFSIDEVKWVKEVGNSSVKGKVFLKLPDGQYKGCAGFNIELLPVAKYSSERIFNVYGNNEQGQILLKDNPPKFTPDPKEYHELLIKGQCNEKDEFLFANVKSGDYYLMAFIIWDAKVDAKPAKDGGAVMKRIHVKENATLEVLSKN